VFFIFGSSKLTICQKSFLHENGSLETNYSIGQKEYVIYNSPFSTDSLTTLVKMIDRRIRLSGKVIYDKFESFQDALNFFLFVCRNTYVEWSFQGFYDTTDDSIKYVIATYQSKEIAPNLDIMEMRLDFNYIKLLFDIHSHPDNSTNNPSPPSIFDHDYFNYAQGEYPDQLPQLFHVYDSYSEYIFSFDSLKVVRHTENISDFIKSIQKSRIREIG